MEKEPLTFTALRANLYTLLDETIRSGKPRLLERSGELYRIKIEPIRKPRKNAEKPSRKIVNDLSKLAPPLCTAMTEDPDWYISPKLDEWDPDHDLD